MIKSAVFKVDGELKTVKPFQSIAVDNPLTVERVTTIPQEGGKSSILAPVSVKGSKDNYSFYDYKRGVVMQLSKRERVLADTWKRTFSYAECVRVLKDEIGVEISPMTAMRWLKRPHVVSWMQEEMRQEAMARGYTRARWVSEGIEMKDMEGKVGFHKLLAWKELGRACGFYEENIVNQNNVQINFTQSDGRA